MGAIDTRPPFATLEGREAKALFGDIATPAYVIDEGALLRNCRLLAKAGEKAGARILLAEKAFSNYDFFPLMAPYLDGTEASGLYEARLGKEKMPGKEVHVFSAAYREDEFEALLNYADHIIFNSISQLERFGWRARQAGKEVGLRINPEHSTQEGHDIYDPCAVGSRLGVTRQEWDGQMTPKMLSLIDGLHFHTLCEQDSDALEETLDVVLQRFGDVLPDMKWLNMGGGHHITRPGYHMDGLVRAVKKAKEGRNLTVYLEPGEAFALNAGYLVTKVLDITRKGETMIAILDASAACHMPDVLEMPYRPPLYGAGEPGDKPFTYRLGGPTCLAGDVVGDYSFASPLAIGDTLVFGDMAIYTTCKNNTFNGMPLPSIYRRSGDGTLSLLARVGYEDFFCRLGRR